MSEVITKEFTPAKPPESERVAEKARLDISAYRNTRPDQALSLLPSPMWCGLQREGTVTILAGESKAKKSWLAMAKAQHAIIGKTFLGHEMLPPSSGSQRKALFLDFELPWEVFLFRWITLAGEHEEEERDLLFDPERIIIECYRESMDESRDWIAHCCSRITDVCGRGDLAVVDCLQPILTCDSNAAELIRPVIAKFQSAATKTGAIADVIDHFNKGEGRGKNRISGSMAKAAGPDTIITLNSDAPGITIGFDLRMDPPRDDIYVEFEPYEFHVFSEEEIESRKEDIQAEKDAQVVHEMFPDTRWYSTKELSTRLGISKTAVTNRLEKYESFIDSKKEGNANFYRRTNNREPKQ